MSLRFHAHFLLTLLENDSANNDSANDDSANDNNESWTVVRSKKLRSRKGDKDGANRKLYQSAHGHDMNGNVLFVHGLNG